MSRWLVLDIGNTHTVGGVFELSQQPNLTHVVRFRTDAQATADEYRMHLAQLFAAQ